MEENWYSYWNRDNVKTKQRLNNCKNMRLVLELNWVSKKDEQISKKLFPLALKVKYEGDKC